MVNDFVNDTDVIGARTVVRSRCRDLGALSSHAVILSPQAKDLKIEEP